jgi:mRNA interferase RelE/StbE
MAKYQVSISKAAQKQYRIRKGDYRIIYDIHDYVLIVDVIAIGHRKDIYE